MKISTILHQIDLGSMALPEFQRGYVWNREQVRELMQSLYRRYPTPIKEAPFFSHLESKALDTDGRLVRWQIAT